MKLPESIEVLLSKAKLNREGLAHVVRFLFRHGEKIVAAIIILVAIGLAVRTLDYQPLPWKPNELEELANDAEKSIKNNGFTITYKERDDFCYAGYAEQIKTVIPLEPFRSDAGWKPVLYPNLPLRGGFEALTAEALRGKSVRRIDLAADQWKRPPHPVMKEMAKEIPEEMASFTEPTIWINLYVTLPLEQQEKIYHQVFDSVAERSRRPEYVYYELEKAKFDTKEEPVWQPMSIYPAGEFQANQDMDYPWDRLVPFEKQPECHNMLLFSDIDVGIANAYAYRIRLYLANPNYNLQTTSVEEGVDTESPYILSDWSFFTRVYVPDRTTVRMQSVTPTDSGDFPRQTPTLRAVRGTVILEYYDIELGLLLPPVEKRGLGRGMLCNMTKKEANDYINRVKTAEETVNINYPESGLRSNVCVLDFSGGRKLQKTLTSEAQSSPDLFTASKALLLLPDGTMQISTTALPLAF